MQVTYDQGADAIYVHLSRAAVAATVEIRDGVAVDYDTSGRAVGVELLDVSQGIDLTGVPRATEIAALLDAYPFPVSA